MNANIYIFKQLFFLEFFFIIIESGLFVKQINLSGAKINDNEGLISTFQIFKFRDTIRYILMSYSGQLCFTYLFIYFCVSVGLLISRGYNLRILIVVDGVEIILI